MKVVKKLAVCGFGGLGKKKSAVFLSTSCVFSIVDNAGSDLHSTEQYFPPFFNIVAHRENCEVCHNTWEQTDEAAVVQGNCQGVLALPDPAWLFCRLRALISVLLL